MVMLNAEYETIALQDLFLGMVRRLAPEVVLELGCYRAEFSIACRRFLPHAAIHAFEANPHVYSRKKAKIEAAGVRCHHMAIGDAVRPVEFLVRTREGGDDLSPKKGSNSLRLRSFAAEYERVDVPMVTVDHFAQEGDLLGRPCAMWIDLEGCAWEALIGAEAMLSTTMALMVEVEDAEIWVGQRLAGDVDQLLTARGFKAVARDQEYPRQHNVIYQR